jgi:hypothetical protein
MSRYEGSKVFKPERKRPEPIPWLEKYCNPATGEYSQDYTILGTVGMPQTQCASYG